MDIANDRVIDTITGEVLKVSEYQGVWFSASLLEDFATCPAKAYARITKQKQINPGIALINGTAAHRGMELWLKERRDPIKTYNETFRYECDKQSIDAKLPDNEKKRLEGEKMVACSWELFKSESFLARIDPSLVEAKFKLARNGRMFVGKLDLVYFKEQGRYNVVDFKTGKTAPKQFELDNDLQFNIYPWATFNDINLPTYGLWPEYAVWFHMRGQNENRGADGKVRRETKSDPSTKPIWKFDFPTHPTKETVDLIMRDTVDPLCADIEDGRWRRNRQDHCLYCNYYDKAKQRCGAELPCDGTAERASQIELLSGGQAA